MKRGTFHNRVQRHEFTFERSDIFKLLKEAAQKFSTQSINAAAAVEWEMLSEHDEDGGLARIVWEQRYEYLSEGTAQPAPPDAVDPVPGVVAEVRRATEDSSSLRLDFKGLPAAAPHPARTEE